jgi:transcriptional regulator with XRE-family HTH domain
MKQNSVAIGHYLSQLRDHAGLKQAELARKITWSQAVLSRVESGDREVTTDELDEVLKAIGSEDALRLAGRLQREWAVLPAPPLDHPDQETLWSAEEAAQQLEALSKNDQVTASFQRRLDEYLQELRQIGALVLRRDHTIAFIGSIGIGKSTAICRMAGLEVPQEDGTLQPVLEAGAGGITICEVHVYTGPQYGLSVEPCSDEEIRQHVNDFAEHIGRSGGNTDEGAANPDSDSQGISKEIERAIRNMAGLRVRKEKVDGKFIRRDEAKRLASECPSSRELVVEVLSRMKLHKRDARHIWYDASKGKSPMAWLKESFEAINNGRHGDFTLPKRIEVVVPSPVLSGIDLTTRIVDTKGIDRTAARADLEVHLNDPHTLAILCSGFNNAPSAEARLLLERAKEAGVRHLTLKAALAALPRPEEALAVKDDAGERVETVEEGYDLKGDQVRTALEPMGLQGLPTTFFNAREDAPANLQQFVVDQLLRVRSHLTERLNLATSNALQVVANQAQEQTQAVLREAAAQLKNWLLQNDKCPSLKQQIQVSLIKELAEAHASTIHAAVRRGGDWPNLSYGHQLGHGAKVLAVNSLGRRVQDFKAIAENLRTNPEYVDAVMLISQSERVLLTAFDDLLRKMQLLGETLFENELRKDTAFWRDCESEWGKGGGYRERIAQRSRDWFDDDRRNELNSTIQSLLSSQWKESLDRVSALLDV